MELSPIFSIYFFCPICLHPFKAWLPKSNRISRLFRFEERGQAKLNHTFFKAIKAADQIYFKDKQIYTDIKPEFTSTSSTQENNQQKKSGNEQNQQQNMNKNSSESNILIIEIIKIQLFLRHRKGHWWRWWSTTRKETDQKGEKEGKKRRRRQSTAAKFNSETILWWKWQ